MTPERQDASSPAQCLQCGIVVTVIAVILGCGPFVAKIYLRSTVQHIDVNLPKWSVSRSEGTMDFLNRELKEAYERALSLGGPLDASNHARSQKELVSYRNAVTLLNDLHTKLESSLAAIKAEECNWQYPLLKGRVEAHEAAGRRARDWNNRMMVVVTLITTVFILFVLRSARIPEWAKKISTMAAGAILAGWLPL
jgi:hypothetical protein